MACRNNRVVGRTVGIINHRASEAWSVKKCRLLWFDFIDDYEVFKSLSDTVAQRRCESAAIVYFRLVGIIF